jgi:hypothetical protein
MGLVIAMGLKAMGIADSIVNLAFGLTLGAVAVAFALAFGLGGRQPAERVLTDLIDCARKQAKKPNSQSHIKTEPMMTSSTPSEAHSKSSNEQVVPDELVVDPKDKPLNNPYGSTGEAEQDVDIQPKDDPK